MQIELETKEQSLFKLMVRIRIAASKAKEALYKGRGTAKKAPRTGTMNAVRLQK